jgi:hypothetical protein
MQLDEIRTDYAFKYELANALKYKNYMQMIPEIPTYDNYLDNLVPVWTELTDAQMIVMTYRAM